MKCYWTRFIYDGNIGDYFYESVNFRGALEHSLDIYRYEYEDCIGVEVDFVKEITRENRISIAQGDIDPDDLLIE